MRAASSWRRAAHLPHAETERAARCAALLLRAFSRALLRLLQTVVPAARVDVHRAHGDAVLARIPHDLGRGVEAHGLGVQQRARERVRVVALEPGGDVGQQREARGVGFREAVVPEPLDLAEAALRKRKLVAARHHAPDHLFLELAEGAAPTEGGHGAAQRVGLVRRELRRLYGDAHRLLLEERHAEGFFEHPAQLVRRAVLRRGRGVDHLLQPVAAAQVGMHHVALDRAGAHDRDLDHQIVEAAGPEPRQHVHLRPALDLEDADRIGPAQHVVDRRIVLRHRGERQMQALVLGQQFEGLADAGQHAEPQHVDLHQAERLKVVLVPLDEGAVLHRPVADGHDLLQAPRG